MHPSMKQPGYCTRFTSMRDTYFIRDRKDGTILLDTSVLVFDMDVSESSGYRDFVWAIKLNRLSLNVIGLWPKPDGVAMKGFGPDIRVGFTFFMITFVSGIPLVCSLMRVWGDMMLMVDNLRLMLSVIVALLKLVIMRWKQTVLSSIVNTITEDWLAPKLSADRDVMIKRAWAARLIIIYGYVITISAYILLIVFPYFHLPRRHLKNFTDWDKPLALQMVNFYVTDQGLLFELTFLAQAIAVFLATIIYTSVIAFFGFVILHICGQLENLKRRMASLASCKDFNRALSSSIITHLRLIRYANNTETTFTLILFVLVLQFCILFCIYGFILITMITDENIHIVNFSHISYMLIAVICLLLQTFLYCFGGDLISEQCNAVYRTICNLDWYTLEPRKARNFILLMLLAKEPFRITAGKVFPLTMTTFCSLLKTSAGYVSFLLAIRN